MKLTKTSLEEALQDYVKNPVHFTEFAKRLGIAPNYAGEILQGRARNDVVRPPGFTYVQMQPPTNKRRKYTDKQIARALKRYVDEEWESIQFSKYLGMSPSDGLGVLRGENYKNVPRPKGFELRLSGEKRKKKVEEGLRRYFAENWNVQHLAEFLEFSLSSARRLLAGETYHDVPTPTS